MADKARVKTDKMLKSMEKKLRSMYETSKSEITKEWKLYMAKAEAKIKTAQVEYDNALKQGNKTLAKELKSNLDQQKFDLTLKNKKYNQTLKDVTKGLSDVNKQALGYVNGKMLNVYVVNNNAFEDIAKQNGINFTLVDENVIKRRVEEGDIKLPYKDLDRIKDQRWNTKQLNSQVTQGILRGESMQTIAKRIEPIVNNNRAAAIRNARTMVTGAENVGRLDRLYEMEEEGAVLRKMWRATPDERTRESHALMDGETAKIDEEFSNGLMYPADPDGDPAEVYNCRCSMETELIGFRRGDHINYISGKEGKYDGDF